MKKLLLLFAATVTIAHAQLSTVDQIKRTIQEINQLLLTTPDIKTLLDEQAKLYAMQQQMDDRFNINDINEEYIQKDQEICLEAQRVNNPAITQQKIDENKKNRKKQLRKRPLLLDEEDHIVPLRIDQIRTLVMENPRVKNLFDQLENLKNQLRNEKPCSWKQIVIDLENTLILKRSENIY